MEYKKERNFVVAYNNDRMCGKWDFTTGQFYGISGKPVKGVPSAFTYNNLPFMRDGNIIGGAVRFYREYVAWNEQYTPARAQRLEALISVGLYPAHYNVLDDTAPLTKNLVDYVKTHYHGEYTRYSVANYLFEEQYKKELENLPNVARSLVRSFVENENLPIEYVLKIMSRLNLEHMFEKSVYNCNLIDDIVENYYEWSMDLYGEVKVTPHIVSRYYELMYLHDGWKTANWDKLIKENNDLPCLYYENDTYLIRPLLSRADFHAEGEAQGNCVEHMYMERVIDGRTNVVVIRAKNDPDASLVTCEVNTKNRAYPINQYLARFNRKVTDLSLIQLRREYEAHLAATL